MAPPKSAKSHKTGRSKPQPKHDNTRTLKRKREVEDIDGLNTRIEELDVNSKVDQFSDLPLSKPTLSGLEKSHFKTTTDVQKKAIPLALKGSDILGAAKTGSGKTLAFLIPVLENLYRQRWTDEDGLGALILAPTRELAIQIFDVLRKVGRYHQFSAGLVIGGKSLQEEQERLPRMNILICTPGRMLQHLDQTASLGLDNLQILVLDEADRILDMGFKSTVDAIVEHLPQTRQTMLFSATQTKKLDDLRRLSVQDPQYISVHEKAETATPKSLQQYYIVAPLPQKIDTLWSFIRANTKSKILVFLSSAKQVRFLYEAYRHMQPGISLLHLHGRQKQTARLDITKRFSSMKTACLFATDVAARGLDFPAVDWVIQVDCPEDVDTYIHRVGRTARYERDGRAVLFLEPTEQEGMLKRLEKKSIPIELIKVRQKKQESVQHQLQNMCFKDPELKYLGQKAFISYARSVYVQHDKEIFQIDKLPLQEFATSLGLPGAPKIKFQKGADAKSIKNRPRANLDSSSDEDEGEATDKKDKVRTKVDRMFERQNQDVLAPHRQRIVQDDQDDQDARRALIDGDDDEADDFLSVRRRLDEADLSDAGESNGAKAVIHVHGGTDLPVDSKRREKMLKSKKALLKYGAKGSKLVFDEDGNAREVYELEDEETFRKRGEATEQRQKFVEKEAAKVQADDVRDKELHRQKKKEKKEKRKARGRGDDEDEDGEGAADLGAHLPVVEMEYLGSDGDDGDDDAASDGDAEVADDDGDGIPKKKPKKWFQQNDSDSGDEGDRPRKKKRKVAKAKGMLEDAETLEDLEALAQSYL